MCEPFKQKMAHKEISMCSMESHTPVTGLNNSNLWKTEDSGYHTSLTPGSLLYSDVSIDNGDHGNYNLTPEANYRSLRKFRQKHSLSTWQESPNSSPIQKRGVKRPYQDVENSLPTPTTKIAGDIQKLTFTEFNVDNSHGSIALSLKSGYSSSSDESRNNHEYPVPFPSTPIKKICRNSCQLSPLRKSAKKLNFAIHSLKCTSSGLLPTNNEPQRKAVKKLQFKPKMDIIDKLYSANAIPPLQKILNYLSYEDVKTFNSVSLKWNDIWIQLSYKRVKSEYKTYLNNVKENQENKEQEKTPKKSTNHHIRSLKEVHNILKTKNSFEYNSQRSPPGTPKTNKFKKFAKSASLDYRPQIWCVRCSQPAKVFKESSGEEWAECTSTSCSFKFCKFCKCDCHPGKKCFQYDLDGPSPSKKRDTSCTVTSKKSKRNLRRLLY